MQLFSGEVVQTAFKLAYLWLVLLSFNSFFAETALLSYCSCALASFGAPIVLARLVDFRSYQQMPLIGLMCLFLVSFLVSAISTAKYGIVSSIQGFAWMTFEFFILFAHSAKESVEHVYAELVKVAKSVCWYSFGCSCLGLAMGLIGYVESVPVAEGVVNLFGVHQERLWGVYSDPNIAGVVCVISMLFATWLFARREAGLAFLSLSAVVQMGHIAMSGSRGSMLCVAVSSFVVFGLFCWRKLGESPSLVRSFKSLLAALCGCAVAVACMLSVGGILQKGSELVQNNASYKRSAAVISGLYLLDGEVGVAEGPSNVGEDGEESGAGEADSSELSDAGAQSDASVAQSSDVVDVNTVDIGYRFSGYGDLSEASTGRFSIWASAIDVFESSPLVGVTHRNILAYAQDVMPDTFIAQAGYTTMHNILFDVLVSQGVVGFVLFAIMVAFGVRSVASFLRQTKGGDMQSAALVGILAAICIAAMFYTEILYINSPSSIIFWIVMGAVCHLVRGDAAQTRHDELESEGVE